MSFNFQNYFQEYYVGRICNEFDDPLLVDGGVAGDGPFAEFSGTIVDGYSGNCRKYYNAVESGWSFTGSYDKLITGLYNNYKSSGNESIVGQLGQTGFYSGISNYSYLDLTINHQGYIQFEGTGVLDGYLDGIIYSTGHPGDIISTSVLINSNSPFFISGSFIGTLTGSGLIQLGGSGNIQIPNSSGSSSSGTYSGNSYIKGRRYFSGQESYNSFSGQSSGLFTGSYSGLFSGYKRFACNTLISPDRVCPDFYPLLENCGSQGQLNVQITYPTDGQTFKIDAFNLNNTGIKYYQTIIDAKGDIIDDPSSPGSIPSSSGDNNYDFTCPYYIFNNPTCTGVTDGSVTFIVSNTSPSFCGFSPPYSGNVTYGLDENTIINEVYVNTGYIPYRLTLNDLKEGFYTLNISGASSVKSLQANLVSQSQLEVDINVLEWASDCHHSNGKVEFKWDREYAGYEIHNTLHKGYSRTGFIADDLPAGDYIASVYTNGTCDTDYSFNIRTNNTIFAALLGATGVTCSGGLNDGSILVSGAGGVEPYTYNWITLSGATGNYRANLPTGKHTVKVTDSIGCNSLSDFFVGKRDFDLSSTTVITRATNSICCQEQDSQALPEISIQAYGGKPPYTYTWDTVPTTNGQVLKNVKPGSYTCHITDSVGCSIDSYTNTFTSITNCNKIRWESSNGIQSQVYEYLSAPLNLPTSAPFIYNEPGVYVLKLSIADSYGRVGIDCIKIFISPEYRDAGDGSGPIDIPDGPIYNDPFIPIADPPNNIQIVNPPSNTPIENPPPNNPTYISDGNIIPPAVVPGNPDIGSGGNNGSGGSGGEGGGSSHHKPPSDSGKICCQLLSAGVNDSECKTICKEGSCNPNDPVFTQQEDKVGPCVVSTPNPGNCGFYLGTSSIWVPQPCPPIITKACDSLWSPEKGTCCISRTAFNVINGEFYQDIACHEIKSCDGASACEKFRQSPDDLISFKAGGVCDTNSPDYKCDVVGKCCVPDGLLGLICEDGITTLSNCNKKGGTLHGDKNSTCASIGATQHLTFNNKYYCELYNGVCCETYSGKEGGTCGNCEELDFFACKAKEGMAVGVDGVVISSTNWIFIPPNISISDPVRPSCANNCHTNCPDSSSVII